MIFQAFTTKTALVCLSGGGDRVRCGQWATLPLCSTREPHAWSQGTDCTEKYDTSLD